MYQSIFPGHFKDKYEELHNRVYNIDNIETIKNVVEDKIVAEDIKGIARVNGGIVMK